MSCSSLLPRCPEPIVLELLCRDIDCDRQVGQLELSLPRRQLSGCRFDDPVAGRVNQAAALKQWQETLQGERGRSAGIANGRASKPVSRPDVRSIRDEVMQQQLASDQCVTQPDLELFTLFEPRV